MVKHVENGNDLIIDEITGERIKKELYEVVSKLIGSDRFELSIDHGSKKGNWWFYFMIKARWFWVLPHNINTFPASLFLRNLYARILYRFSKLGDNFNGEIYRVLYKTEHDDTKQSSLILKIALRNETRREMTGARSLFLREISMYDQVIIHLI